MYFWTFQYDFLSVLMQESSVDSLNTYRVNEENPKYLIEEVWILLLEKVLSKFGENSEVKHLIFSILNNGFNIFSKSVNSQLKYLECLLSHVDQSKNSKVKEIVDYGNLNLSLIHNFAQRHIYQSPASFFNHFIKPTILKSYCLSYKVPNKN